MNSLLLSEIFPPATGGSGRWFFEIYRRLPRDQYFIAAGEHPRQGEFDRTHNLQITRLPLKLTEWGIATCRGLLGYMQRFFRLRRLIKQKSIRQLHCARLLPEGWLAWMLSKATGIHYLCYIHGEELSYGTHSRELEWMMRRVLVGSQRVIANSRNTARLVQAWGVPEHQIVVLHPGVDIERFRPAARSERIRSSLGWQDRPVVLTVGRLQKRKGHDQLIRAVAAIRCEIPDILYAIVGDGEERPLLEQLVQELDLDQHVLFHGDITDESLICCYQQCDLFALPNRNINGDIEGFGMVLLEAQACGKAVLAGASGGTAETMRVGETGMLVSCDGPDELAATISGLLSDPARCERMGSAGRQWVTANFGWESLAQEAATVLGAELSSPLDSSEGIGSTRQAELNRIPSPPSLV